MIHFSELSSSRKSQISKNAPLVSHCISAALTVRTHTHSLSHTHTHTHTHTHSPTHTHTHTHSLSHTHTHRGRYPMVCIYFSARGANQRPRWTTRAPRDANGFQIGRAHVCTPVT